MQWQDISTAPKDGTPILVAHRLHSNDVHGYVPWTAVDVVMAWWDGDEKCWEMCFMEDGAADTNGYSSQFFMPLARAPTHWMPLPPPASGE